MEADLDLGINNSWYYMAEWSTVDEWIYRMTECTVQNIYVETVSLSNGFLIVYNFATVHGYTI